MKLVFPALKRNIREFRGHVQTNSIYSWEDDKLIHFCAFSAVLRFSFLFYSFPLKDPNMNYASKGQVRTEGRGGEGKMSVVKGEGQ